MTEQKEKYNFVIRMFRILTSNINRLYINTYNLRK